MRDMKTSPKLTGHSRECVEREILDTLPTRWIPWDKAVARVRSRWGHIADFWQVSDVLNDLWDEDRVDRRSVQVAAGNGSTFETIGQTQVKKVSKKKS